MKRRRGTALVETAAAALLASSLLAGAFTLGRLALRARRAGALARHAAALSSVGTPAGLIDAELRDYADRWGEETLYAWRFDRFLASPSAVFYRLSQASVDVAVPMPAWLGGDRRLTCRAVLEEDLP